MSDLSYPVTSKNVNVRSMYESYQGMLAEIAGSLSKETVATSTADAVRWKSYIAGFRAYSDYYQSLTVVDWPVTKGRSYELAEPQYPVYAYKENTAVHDLMDMVVNARDELAVSASNDLPMMLLPADMIRQQSYWVMMEGLIDKYLLVIQPLDQPVTAAIENLLAQ